MKFRDIHKVHKNPSVKDHIEKAAMGFGFHPILWIVPIIIFFAFFKSKNYGITPLHDAFAAGGFWRLWWSGLFAGFLLAKTMLTAYILGSQRKHSQPAHDKPANHSILDKLLCIFRPNVLLCISNFITKLIMFLLGVFLLCSTMYKAWCWMAVEGHDGDGVTISQMVGLGIAILISFLFYYCIIPCETPSGEPCEESSKEQGMIDGFKAFAHRFKHTRFIQILARVLAKITSSKGADDPELTPHLIAAMIEIPLLGVSAFYFLAYWLSCPTYNAQSSIGVCLFLSGIVSFYGITAYISRSLVFIMILFPVLLWIGKGYTIDNNYPFQNMPTASTVYHSEMGEAALEKRLPVALTKPEEVIKPTIINNADGIAPELQKVDFKFKDPDNRKIIIVTTTGGGISAATWTVAVLNRLERENSKYFTRDLRVITGASGGMVGAAFYVKNRLDKLDSSEPKEPDPDDNTYLAKSYIGVGKDHLSPVISRLVFHDVFWDFFPTCKNKFDRGLALEQSFDTAWDPRMSKTINSQSPNAQSPKVKLLDLAPYEQKGQLPSLVFTPMIIEDGRRLFLSNLNLDQCFLTGGNLIQSNPDKFYEPKAMSVSALELRKLSKESYNSLLLSTAARMNASYPFVSPAGILGGNFTDKDGHENQAMRLRIGDAGYYDNLGVNIAARWLLQYKKFFSQEDANKKKPEILMIQIRVTPGYAEGLRYTTDNSTGLSRAFEWGITPPAAVYNSLFQGMQYHNDENIEELSKAFGANFKTAILECPERQPLSWALSEDEIESFENWTYPDVRNDQKSAKDTLLNFKHQRFDLENTIDNTKKEWNQKKQTSDIDRWIKKYNKTKTPQVDANAKFLEEQFQGIKKYLSQ